MDSIHSKAYSSFAPERVDVYPCNGKSTFQEVAKLKQGWNTVKLKHGVELPTVESLVNDLQDCRKEGNLQRAFRLHSHILENGLEVKTVLGDYLIPTLVECGGVIDAQHIFFRLTYPNEYSWSSLIRGFSDRGDLMHALYLYKEMQENSISPTKHTFVALLQASTRLKCIEEGFKLHAEISREGFNNDSSIGNCLVDMYAKSGSFDEAGDVFDELVIKDVVSWTVLISGYVEHSLAREAFSFLEEMQLKGVSPNSVTMVCGLKAVELLGSIDKGQETHSTIMKLGLEEDVYLGSALVGMYASCGSLKEAQIVFDSLQVRDIVSWNSLITGYADHDRGERTLECLRLMQQDGLACNPVSFTCGLIACGHLGATERGREVHADIVRAGFENDHYVGAALVDMYSRSGLLMEAGNVSDSMPARSLVSWSALLTGYAQHDCGEEALAYLKRMQVEGFSPDATVFVSCLKACGRLGGRAISKGQDMHQHITKLGLEGQFTSSALVSMYAKCGSLPEARKVFDESPEKGLVLRNALMAGYIEHGFWEEARACFLQMQVDNIFPNRISWNSLIGGLVANNESDAAFLHFELMQEQGLLPDTTTFVNALKSCAGKTALEVGRRLHSQVHILESPKGSELANITTAILDMYSKCGSMLDAQQVFDGMPTNDIVTWTALIAGYGRQGESEFVFHWFEKMKETGLQPNDITFLIVLNACSHLGLVDRGQCYFDAMRYKYGISPSIQHHNCMVDLHRRAGQLEEAILKLEDMPFQPNQVTWGTVLAGELL